MTQRDLRGAGTLWFLAFFLFIYFFVYIVAATVIAIALGFAAYGLYKLSGFLARKLREAPNKPVGDMDLTRLIFLGFILVIALIVLVSVRFSAICSGLSGIGNSVLEFFPRFFRDHAFVTVVLPGILLGVAAILVGIFAATGNLKLRNFRRKAGGVNVGGSGLSMWSGSVSGSPASAGSGASGASSSSSASSSTVGGAAVPPSSASEARLLWKRVGNEITILGMTGETYELRIPDAIEGLPVTSIQDGSWNQGKPTGAFADNDALAKVTLPSGLRKIGAYAFKGCDYLESVKLPKGLEEIGFGAFYGCGNLESVKLPSGLSKLRGGAFFNCASLERVKVPEGVTTLEKGVFDGCVSLRRLELPSTLTTVDDDALQSCASLVRVDLPPSVTTIGKRAFRGCAALHEFHLPPRLEKLGDGALSGCPRVDAVSLPPTLAVIGTAPFAPTTVIFTAPGSYGEKWATRYARSVVGPRRPDDPRASAPAPSASSAPTVPVSRLVALPDGLRETVSPSAPERRDALLAVRRNPAKRAVFYLPHVDPDAPVDETAGFFPPANLPAEFVVPESVGGKHIASIGEAAFKNALAVTTVAVPFGVERIENHAFAGCRALEQAFLPSTVRFVGARAFVGCSALRMLVLPGSVTEIEADAFEPSTCLCVIPGSYAATWAKTNGHAFRLVGKGKSRT